MVLIFFFVSSIFSIFPNWNQKTKYVFYEMEIFPFFLKQVVYFCTSRRQGWGYCNASKCFTSLAQAEKGGDEGRGREPSLWLRQVPDKCQKPVAYRSRLPTGAGMLKLIPLLFHASGYLLNSPYREMASTTPEFLPPDTGLWAPSTTSWSHLQLYIRRSGNSGVEHTS